MIRRSVQRRGRRTWCSSWARGPPPRSTSWWGCSGLRIAEPLEREYRARRGTSPARAAGGLRRPLRAPLERAALAGVGGRRGGGRARRRGATSTSRTSRRKLAAHADRPLKLGAFSAASNVTGVLTRRPRSRARPAPAAAPTPASTTRPRRRTSPSTCTRADRGRAHRRAVPLDAQVHGWAGGLGRARGAPRALPHPHPRAPRRRHGRLRRRASTASRSTTSAGSTSARRAARRPSSATCARASAFLVKEMLGPGAILAHEHGARRARARSGSRGIRASGSSGRCDVPRLAILSFNIDGLHHDLVSVLLDHLFGIQNRAGCSCAGPYGHRLLGIDARHKRALPGADRARRPRRQARLGAHVPAVLRVATRTSSSCSRRSSSSPTTGDDFIPAYQLGWLRRRVASHRAADDGRAAHRAHRGGARGGGPELRRGRSRGARCPSPSSRSERERYLARAHQVAAELRARWLDAPPRWNPGTGRAEIDDLVWFRWVWGDQPWARLGNPEVVLDECTAGELGLRRPARAGVKPGVAAGR